jgi:threonyl-tRNA synthetase
MNELDKKRHSLAHLLAAAIEKLYPNAKITLGPAIDNGFYYDIDFGDIKTSDADLKKIQKTMKKLANTWTSFEGKTISKEEALKLFENNEYKKELIQEIVERGEDITVYTSGDFIDLCRGGHVQNFKEEVDMNAWKLDRIAGAYWRGDENNKMLTRIYGLAFDTKDDLDAYLKTREEAKKRDHRKIGQDLQLFSFSTLVGSGLPLFTPKGTKIRNLIVEKIHNLQKEYGWESVSIPHITKKELYETSGHWEKFSDELFKVYGKKDTEFVMKPMNCPHHTQIFKAFPKSYRDLPVRYAENTIVYRDEQAGELLGLARVRAITQDDGHAFVRPDQIKEEVKNIVSIIKNFYNALDMLNDNYWVSLSLMNPAHPEKYMNDGGIFERAESILEEIAKEESLPYKRIDGEAAFYGPKLDFQFKDALGREWQLGTVQLDFSMPRRFGLEYTDENGKKQTPVMINRAIAGSLERFMAVVLEHFAGWLPLFLAPTQIAIIPINNEAHNEYAKEIFDKFKGKGVRIELWNDEKDNFGKKVRKAKNEKLPYWIVIGDEEMSNKTITVESKDKSQKGINFEDFFESIKDRIN